MKFVNKLTGLLVAAFIMVLSIAATESVQAQPYTVCNNTTVPVAVCLQANCGGVIVNIGPCPAIIPPGGCFTWPVPAACVVTGVTVGGVFYGVPAAIPFCYGVLAPPPNWVCYTGGVPQVIIR